MDDNAIRKRLEIYDRETAPLVEHYRAKHANVVGIHADQPVDDVFAEVREALEYVANNLPLIEAERDRDAADVRARGLDRPPRP